jgi:hypothetical protein
MKPAAALCAVMLAGLQAYAGPFGLISRKAAPQQAQQPSQADYELASAQGVANRIARTGIFRHWGGYNGYEGIGLGGSPAAAEAACCYRTKFAPRDVGIARMASGAFVACCRY